MSSICSLGQNVCDRSKQNKTKPHRPAAAPAGFQDPISQTMGGPSQQAEGAGGSLSCPLLECQDPEQGQQQVEVGNGID